MIIDVGIINYNGGEELTECVKSLKAQTEPVRVFVFDNASTDQSILQLKAANVDCNIIESEQNLGYAGACNGLLKNMDSDIQVLCNMDLEFAPDWAEKLRSCFERHPEAGSVASLVMEKSGVVNAVGVLFGADLFAKNEASGMNFAEADVREKEVFGFFGPYWHTYNMSMYYYCGDDPSTEAFEGTYGDWAVCNAPVGFYWGGDWVAASKEVTDMEKKAVVADILKWMTLDYDENSLQYLLANGLYEPNQGVKEAVVSGTVMEKADGSIDLALESGEMISASHKDKFIKDIVRNKYAEDNYESVNQIKEKLS